MIWISIDKADMERRWLERSILKEQSNNIAGQLFFEAKKPFEFLSGLKKKILNLLLFSQQVKSTSLWPNEMQHTRLPCPSLSPGVCSHSGPLSLWRHPNISSSVIPFSPCPQSFPASISFPMSHLFTSGSQSTGALA